MKTAKKGFTLIELIVVIAIIGVLAAMLVPTMLGYVKKSKISAANTVASSIYKAINTAMIEFSEEDKPLPTGEISFDCSSGSYATTDWTGIDSGIQSIFKSKLTNYFADIKKVKKINAKIDGGMCVAVAATVDGTYIGTVPMGVVTTNNYDIMTVSKAFSEAKKKANS